jgi:hypothetical protein
MPLSVARLYLTQKYIGSIDRLLAGTYADRAADETTGETTSHLTNPAQDAWQVIGYMRASVWSFPIQNRINRNQGGCHTSCTVPLPSATLSALTHIMKILLGKSRESVFEMQSVTELIG